MDLNVFAQKISQREGGKVNLPIAQIKEVLNCAGQELKALSWWQRLVVLRKLVKETA